MLPYTQLPLTPSPIGSALPSSNPNPKDQAFEELSTTLKGIVEELPGEEAIGRYLSSEAKADNPTLYPKILSAFTTLEKLNKRLVFGQSDDALLKSVWKLANIGNESRFLSSNRFTIPTADIILAYKYYLDILPADQVKSDDYYQAQGRLMDLYTSSSEVKGHLDEAWVTMMAFVDSNLSVSDLDECCDEQLDSRMYNLAIRFKEVGDFQKSISILNKIFTMFPHGGIKAKAASSLVMLDLSRQEYHLADKTLAQFSNPQILSEINDQNAYLACFYYSTAQSYAKAKLTFRASELFFLSLKHIIYAMSQLIHPIVSPEELIDEWLAFDGSENLKNLNLFKNLLRLHYESAYLGDGSGPLTVPEEAVTEFMKGLEAVVQSQHEGYLELYSLCTNLIGNRLQVLHQHGRSIEGYFSNPSHWQHFSLQVQHAKQAFSSHSKLHHQAGLLSQASARISELERELVLVKAVLVITRQIFFQPQQGFPNQETARAMPRAPSVVSEISSSLTAQPGSPSFFSNSMNDSDETDATPREDNKRAKISSSIVPGAGK